MIEKDASNPLLMYWLSALSRAEKRDNAYHSKVQKIIKRYRDDRGESNRSSRFNILWSNVETMKPALYSNTPKPQIERRYKDNDPFTRQSSIVLERALTTNLDLYDFDTVMRQCVQDLLLAGRGVARIRYVPEFGMEIDHGDAIESDAEENMNYIPEMISEKVVCDYVYWQDFIHAPARNWQDVSWVAFRNYLNRREVEDRFGKDSADGMVFEDSSKDALLKYQCGHGKAVVWEIWDKSSGQVLWIAKPEDSKHARLLEVQNDPLGLSGFFPCPQPLLATVTSDDLTPVPDYLLYQDQALELDILTSRISALAKIIRLRGVYDASAEAVQRLLGDSGSENQLIPVDQWSALSQKGGLDSVISWMPIEKMVQVLRELYQTREQVKRDLYEITGIADIIRGSTAPAETATAQQLKGRFATLRISERQKSVARFSRDLIRMMAEVMAEHFSPDTLSAMTGQSVVPEMLDLFRSEEIRNWRIDIETDSTIAADEIAEKQTRVEFLNATTGFIKEVTPLVQTGALPLSVARAMLLFGARGFKVGRELEGALESLGQDQATERMV